MTTSSEHTPGPWHVANGIQIRSDRDQIAKVWMMRGGEGNANARLIAAAPDLLEALQSVLSGAVHYQLRADEQCVLDARAAIAKATGEAA